MLLPPTAQVDAAAAGFADGGWVFLPLKVLRRSHLPPEDVGGVRRLEQGADFGSAAEPSAVVGVASLGTGQRGRGLPRSRCFCRK